MKWNYVYFIYLSAPFPLHKWRSCAEDAGPSGVDVVLLVFWLIHDSEEATKPNRGEKNTLIGYSVTLVNIKHSSPLGLFIIHLRAFCMEINMQGLVATHFESHSHFLPLFHHLLFQHHHFNAYICLLSHWICSQNLFQYLPFPKTKYQNHFVYTDTVCAWNWLWFHLNDLDKTKKYYLLNTNIREWL